MTDRLERRVSQGISAKAVKPVRVDRISSQTSPDFTTSISAASLEAARALTQPPVLS